MNYIAAYMLRGSVVCLVIFCADEVNEMRKCAKRYAEAKIKLDAMVWKEAQDYIMGNYKDYHRQLACREDSDK